MSGVAVLWYRLSHDDDVLAIVPVSRIKAGQLPLSLTLPAIAITQVSSTPWMPLSGRTTRRFNTDRVQVSAFVKDQQGNPPGSDYPGLDSLMRRIANACTHRREVINGITVDSIVPESEGPDIVIPETSILMRSRDFMVRYYESSS